jgi:hypothetical protein
VAHAGRLGHRLGRNRRRHDHGVILLSVPPAVGDFGNSGDRLVATEVRLERRHGYL